MQSLQEYIYLPVNGIFAKLSEIDRNAICGYAAIHKGLTSEMIMNYGFYPDEEQMIQELVDKNIGFNPEKEKTYNWNGIRKNRQYEIRKHWLANHLCHNLGDISRIETLPTADFWSCSFPCTDISCAGNEKRLEADTGTRSLLVWEFMRLLKKAVQDGTQPKYLLFENVKNLVEKFMPDFQKILDVLHSLGYRTYWDIINAKNCGIPQTRERVFVVCIREGIESGEYIFPMPFECERKVGDILDPDTDVSYSIKDKRLIALLDTLMAGNISTGRGSQAKQGQPDRVLSFIQNGSTEKEKKRYSATRLTPGQCFQLMGLTSEDADKCKKLGVADGQAGWKWYCHKLCTATWRTFV